MTLHTLPQKMTFVPNQKSAGYKGHLLCTDVSAIMSYIIRARLCKSSDVNPVM